MTITTLSIDVTVDGLRERQFVIVDTRRKILGRVGVTAQGLAVASMRQLFVDPNHRHQGIGSLLVEKCFEFAKDRGCKSLNLSLHKMNVELGAKFYEPLGFILAAEFSDGERCYAKPIL